MKTVACLLNASPRVFGV